MKLYGVRGGSWVLMQRQYVRAADKGSDRPKTRDKYVGFRTHLTGKAPRV